MPGQRPEQINTFNGGMNKEAANSSIAASQYRHAENLRMVSIDGESTGALSNVRGNTLSFNIPKYPDENGTAPDVIGHATLRDDLILFTVVGSVSQIWKLVYDFDDVSATPAYTKIYEGNLGFDVNNPIEAIGRYESDTIQRVYWTDNNNPVRSINIADYPDTLTLDPDTLELGPGADLRRPTFRGFEVGSLKVGVHQYAYRLGTESGALTKFSTFSDFMPILKNFERNSNFFSETNAVDGSDIGEESGRAIKLKIENIDSRYDYIEVVNLYYSKRDVDPEVTIIEQRSIPTSGEIDVIHTGNENTISMSVEEVTSLASNLKTAKTLAVKDNRLIAGNITTTPLSTLTIDARAYRYRKSDGTTYSNTDDINPYNTDIDAELDNNAYAYQSDLVTLGGTGDNVSYKFITEDVGYGTTDFGPEGSSPTPGQFTSTTQVGYFNPLSATGLQEESSGDATWRNFKSSFYLSHLKGYTRGEIYRFGLVLYDLKGNPGYVNWIGDIKFPKGYETADTAFGLGSTSPTATASLKVLGIEFTVNIPDTTGISGYRIVRMERTGADKSIIASGALFDTYNYWIYADDGVNPIPYSDPSIVGNLTIGETFDPDSDPFKSDNGNYFIANGLYPANWDDLTDVMSWDVAQNGTHNVQAGKVKMGKIVKKNDLFTLESPDLHFLGDVSVKAGDHLRIIGKATGSTVNVREDALIDASSWQNSPANHPVDGKRPYPSVFAVEDLTSSYCDVYENNNDDFTQLKNIVEFDEADADYNGATRDNDLRATAPLQHSWIEYFPLYNLDRLSGLSFADRKIEIYSGYNVAAGEDITIGYGGGADRAEFEFKNAYVGVSFTVDNVTNIDAGTNTGKYGDDNVKAMKFNYSGIGNKTMLLFTEGINLDNAPYSITYQPLYMTLNAYIDGVGSKVRKLSASYQLTPTRTDATMPEGDRPIVQYVRDIVGDQYGGLTSEAREGQEYIPCGAFVDITSGDRVISVFGGDTVVGYYNVTKSDFRPDGKGFRVGYTFPVESTVAFDLREGNNFMNQNNSDLKDSTPDDYILDSVYLFTMDKGAERYYTLPSYVEEVNNFDNRIVATSPKTNGELVDAWRNFDTISYLDVDGMHGRLNKLLQFRDTIFFLQDSGFGQLAVSPRAVVQTGEAGPLELGEGRVLYDFVYITTEYGSIQQFSPIVTNGAIYFVDSKRKKIFQFAEQLTPISDPSINSLLHETETLLALNKDNPYQGEGITSGYDPNYMEVMFTFHKTTPQTVAFSEPIRNFSTFYSFISVMCINLSDIFLTIGTGSSNSLYLHDFGDYGQFYGTYYDSVLKFLVNMAPDRTKVFDNVSYQLESYDVNGVQSNALIDSMRFHTDYQNTDWFTLDSTNSRRVEREWKVAIPRNAVIDSTADIFDAGNLDATAKFKDRIRDKYMDVNIIIENTASNVKKMLHYVKSLFRISAR